MSIEVERRMSESSRAFRDIVWPAIGERFGDVIPVESVSDNVFATELDRRSGVDVWLVSVDGHMRGLASRVQWSDHSYGTFTIRVQSRYGGATEYDKRQREIAANRAGIAGVLSPYYVTQAYVSKDRTRLVAAAIARMRDVIAAVDMDMGWLLPPNDDGTRGYAVKWSVLRDCGAAILEWPRDFE